MKKDFVNGTIKELIEWVSENIPKDESEGYPKCLYCGRSQAVKKKHEKDCLHLRAKKLRKMLVEEKG